MSDRDDDVGQFGTGRARTARTGVAQWPPLWPDKTIVYQIDADLPSPERVTSAIAHWRANTTLKFVQRTPANEASHPNYVRVTKGALCWSSHVGCNGGEQQIKLGPSCKFGEVIHEIGHVVGLDHEHARRDRDQWIRIILDKVPEPKREYLEKLSAGKDFGEYDYGSIMHYPADALTDDKSVSIIPLKPTTAKIGQREKLSKRDIATVEHLYSEFPPGKDAM